LVASLACRINRLSNYAKDLIYSQLRLNGPELLLTALTPDTCHLKSASRDHNYDFANSMPARLKLKLGDTR